MKQISSPENVGELPLDPTVLTQLHRELIELPFGSVDCAAKFWKQETTHLFLIEQNDNLNQIFIDNPQLTSILNTPEFVIPLNAHWTIALTITTDGGGGYYLVFPTGIDDRLDQLLPSLD
ncbi:hypothetical protein [Neptunomonas qingdaonensis]|uniref:Uncharacterized protein n=1 Tax=Neptunomonas qingdaonensis TaxID=1045558 RepID=A0A1I2N2Z5_9GAMM|nr:hypothetical protein [Neptunomonas qingdaonensis]SFF95761.1 hypothetical protein SAMN05216175_102137 [Neptunomonas qingdaonensis]